MRRVMVCEDCGRRVVKKRLRDLGGVFRNMSFDFKVWVHEDWRVPYNEEGRHAYVGGIRARFAGFESSKPVEI